jgi:hypothetical protein
VIVISYGDYDETELAAGYEPVIVHVDTANRPISEERARRLTGQRIYAEIDALSE